MSEITCGRCTKDNGREVVKHASVAMVRACYAAPQSFIASEHEAEALAELAAERRNEQFWENRGADDGFEEWERSQGKLSFTDAWDASDRAQGLTVSTRTGLPLN